MDNNYLSVCQQLELSGLLLLENKMGSEQSLLEEVKFLQPLSFSFIERCRPASAFFSSDFRFLGHFLGHYLRKIPHRTLCKGFQRRGLEICAVAGAPLHISVCP